MKNKTQHDYRICHFGSRAKNYDKKLFRNGSFDYIIWAKGRGILEQILLKHSNGDRLFRLCMWDREDSQFFRKSF